MQPSEPTDSANPADPPQGDSRSHRGEPSATLAYVGQTADGSDDKAKTVIRRSDAGSSVRHLPVRGAATPAEVARVLLGSHLSHFLLEELIGGGGMGAVFRARDQRLDRTVAIKVIPFIGDDPDMLRRFRNEAQSAARLDHPNIARVFDVGMFEGWRYIVFEYIEGTNLRDLVTHDGVLSIDDAVFFTRQIAEALHHASGRGVVHRDVKPSNVLVNTDGETKLVDMGLARSDQLEMSGDMTASGVTLGTFDYISPEQAKDPRDADVRSDLYSLGCTLYFMLTGSPPYPGGTMLQKLLNHGNSPPPDPSELRSGISDSLKAIIQKLLAKSPNDRYQRAIDLVADLQQLAAREGLVRAQSQGTVTINREDSRLQGLVKHLPWLSAAALLLVGAVGLQLLASLRSAAFVLETAAEAAPLQITSDTRLTASGNRAVATESPDSSVPPQPAAANGQLPATQPTDATTDPTAPAGQQSGSAAAPPFGPTPDPGSAAAASGAAINSPGVPANGPGIAASSLTVPADERSTTGTATATADADSGMATQPPSSAGATVDVATVPPRYTGLAGAVGSVLPLPDPLAPLVKIEKIVVGGSVAPSPAIHKSATLADALRAAQQLGVKTIELAVPRLESPPLQIPMDGLTIQSSVGYTEIRFQTAPTAAIQRPVMIQLGTHRIEFQGIHFNWTVRSSAVDGGCLFSVAENRLVRLTDCTITLENLAHRDQVYAFEVRHAAPPATTELFPLDPLSLRDAADHGFRTRTAVPTGNATSPSHPPVARSSSPPLVAIELNNVAARGEMSLIRLLDPVQLQLRWDNGLLACSGHLLLTQGTEQPLASTSNPVQLSFNRVTFWTEKGLISTRLGALTRHPMGIDRDSRNGVFRAGADAAHVQFQGLDFTQAAPRWEMMNPWIQLRGEDNAYDADYNGDRPLLAVTAENGQRQVFWMSQMREGDRPGWLGERSTRWGVRWSVPLDAAVAASQLSVAQFFQDGTVVSGFDRTRLPVFPAASIPPENYPVETVFETEPDTGSPM